MPFMCIHIHACVLCVAYVLQYQFYYLQFNDDERDQNEGEAEKGCLKKA